MVLSEEEALERIRQKVLHLIHEQGISQKDLAHEIGVSETNMSRFLTGKQKIKFDTFLKIAQYFNKPLEYFLADEQGDVPVKPVPIDGVNIQPIRYVPVLGLTGAGDPKEILNGEIEEFIEDYVPIPRWVTDPKAFGARIAPDARSMIPKINPGDIVVACPNYELRKGNVALAWLRDEGAVCRYYYPAGNTIHLQPENSTYEPIIVSLENVSWIYPVVLVIQKTY